MCAALLAVGYGVTTLARRRSSLRGAVAVGALGALLLLVPATAIQLALRSATAPWFYTNDSTYQIELAGDLAADMVASALCDHERLATLPLTSALRYFRTELDDHILRSSCPAGVCRPIAVAAGRGS